MRKKLAIGLFCAVLCGLNLAYTRALLAQQKPKCPDYSCDVVQDCTVFSGGCTCFPWITGPRCYYT